MDFGRCPICHARLDLEAMVQDDAGRELLAIMARLEPELAKALIQYLGLFRPAKSDLSNARAAKLAAEVLFLDSTSLMREALLETVQGMRVKQQDGTFKRLQNHRYLESVLTSLRSRGYVERDTPTASATPRQTSRTAQGVQALQQFAGRSRGDT
ncbi:hypothetical protein [Alloalcanivorax xenomutans]|uniref:hypothetical protein n=1 Tax=Alloalcanivorax xenomutans TaxID=1094342 RepID=UPI003C4955C7